MGWRCDWVFLLKSKQLHGSIRPSRTSMQVFPEEGVVCRRGSKRTLRPSERTDSLLKRFPSSELSDDALASQLNIRLQLAGGAPDVRMVSNEFLQSHPLIKRKDLISYSIGESYRGKKDPEDAAKAYALALKDRPMKDVEGDALYRLGEALTMLGQPDSAAVAYRDYLKKFPNNQFTADAAWALGQYRSGTRRGVTGTRTLQTGWSTILLLFDERPFGQGAGDAYLQGWRLCECSRSVSIGLAKYESR